MTADDRSAFRGTTLAHALLLDVPTIGITEARRRVLAAWQSDSTLRALPDGTWLLTLPEPLAVRAEFAPGLPLIKHPTGWTTPGLDPIESRPAGELIQLPRAGEVRSIPITATTEVETRGWFDLSGLPVHRLTPIDRAPEEPQVPIAATTPPTPDLREGARLGTPSSDATTFRSGLTEATTSRTSRLGGAPPEILRLRWILASTVFLVTAAAVLIATSARPAFHLKSVLIVIVASTLIRLVMGGSSAGGGNRRRAARGTDAGTSATQPTTPRGPGLLNRLWSALVWRSPAGHFLNRKQQRYLQELTRKFERREFDQALRDAIGLNGTALSKLASLRLPTPRTSIRPGSSPPATSSGFGGFTNAYEHLRGLYLQAARTLEAAGQIDEAAFVYADLLDDTRAAVDLLERHDRLALAAQLAESRGLEAPLVVRLWWRAGDRTRAIEVARSRAAFATGIERLHAVDPAMARDLRIAWVDYCRQAGDPVAAVDAAWPDATLRATVVPDIAVGMAMGGPRAAYLFAHLVTEHPTPENLDRALALLDSEDAEARQRFTFALVGLRSTDRMHDKRLATAALRSLLRDGAADQQPVRRAVAVLRDRCDPLVRADLPRLQANSASVPGQSVSFNLEDEPGALPVYDAAALRGGAVLVAHGEQGVRLLTHDGRTRARWDVPVHSLVVADHGGTALLVTKSESLQTINRLDLATRTVRPWTTLPSWKLLESYDGGTVTVIDEDGLSFVDTLSARPKILWRELDALHGIVAVNRTPDVLSLLANVTFADRVLQPKVQLFSWELPSMTLRHRRNLPPEGLGWSQAVLPDQVVAAGDELTSYRRQENPATRELPARELISSGNALGLLTEDGRLTIEFDGREVAAVDCPIQPRLRERDGLVTLWLADGRIAVIDPAGPTVLANFRTRRGS
ncbi:bpX6 domain-containing protein [Kribbella sp. NBC_00382]|uniref:bpX6 domain-containing protein n=1 Tax=Kribbella sp. NBC_00382 TaxID=2975967 RepID=UPI002E1F6C64